jgi:hypothetical protein
MEASIQDIFSKTQYTLHLKSQTCEIKRMKNNKGKLTSNIIFKNLLKILKIKLYAPSIGTKSVKVPPINQSGQMVTI